MYVFSATEIKYWYLKEQVIIPVAETALSHFLSF